MIKRILVYEDCTGQINSYQDAIKLAGKQFVKQGMVVPEYINACVDREKGFPTGLAVKNNIGIAIPHGNEKYVKTSGVSFLRLMKPVNFGLMEDASKNVSCQFIFNLALFQGEQQLKMLRKLMLLFRSDDFLTSIAVDKLDDIQTSLSQELDFN